MNIQTKKLGHAKGFTLIELLVVIAIIGILASVVLASLNTARNKGADAAIKSNLANIRAQAEIQYDSLGCYTNTGGTCNATTPAAVAAGACPASGAANIFGQANIASAIAAAQTAGGYATACSATVAGTAWAVATIQKSAVAAAANSGWCVDSSGKSKAITVATLDATGIAAEVNNGLCVE
jgi:prepilin-type N-terminal cleavage/methylation domain-containing protein